MNSPRICYVQCVYVMFHVYMLCSMSICYVQCVYVMSMCIYYVQCVYVMFSVYMYCSLCICYVPVVFVCLRFSEGHIVMVSLTKSCRLYLLQFVIEHFSSTHIIIHNTKSLPVTLAIILLGTQNGI